MRVGVLGGTFDPIHLGHLHLARSIAHLFRLSRLHFVIAGSPPHKRSDAVSPFCHRYAMLALATSGSRRFLPSLVELESPKSPYSVDTMRKLERQTGRRNLFFIAGGDSLLDVRRWRRSEELLGAYSFVFVVRPRCGGLGDVDLGASLPARVRARLRDLRGLGAAALSRAARSTSSSGEPAIYVVDVGARDISSSEVRARARGGMRIGHLVPPPVREYIQKLNVYGQ